MPNCPVCNAESIVVDSRPKPDGSKRRRRECSSCSVRFTTIETYAEDILVLKEIEKKLVTNLLHNGKIKLTSEV